VSIVPGTAAMGCRGRGGCWEVGCGVEDDASGLSACLACCHVMEAALGGTCAAAALRGTGDAGCGVVSHTLPVSGMVAVDINVAVQGTQRSLSS
jgi:hypothetical protein